MTIARRRRAKRAQAAGTQANRDASMENLVGERIQDRNGPSCRRRNGSGIPRGLPRSLSSGPSARMQNPIEARSIALLGADLDDRTARSMTVDPIVTTPSKTLGIQEYDGGMPRSRPAGPNGEGIRKDWGSAEKKTASLQSSDTSGK